MTDGRGHGVVDVEESRVAVVEESGMARGGPR